MIGKVIINANGDKAISFDDAAWAALPVGATIYSAAFEGVQDFKACGRTVGHADSCAIGWLCGSCEKRLAQSRLIAGFEAEIERLRAGLARPEVTEKMIDAACRVCTGFSGPYGDYNDHLSREAAKEVLDAALADAFGEDK